MPSPNHDLQVRLAHVKAALGIKNKDDLAERLGVSRPMMYFYETGKNEPSDKFIRALINLETEAGINNMTNPDKQGPVRAREDTVKGRASRCGTLVPVVSWAHAGEAQSYEELPEDWHDHICADVGDVGAFALTLRGDSMEPRYYEGDILIVSPRRRADNGGLVVCRYTDGGVIFRQVQVVNKTIRLVPINTRYIPSDHTEEDFTWIYPVVEMRRRLWK